MNRAHREQSTRWQRRAATYMVVCSVALNSSTTIIFSGKLGQQMSINSRNIRQ
jgi:hypothetical protein